MTLISNYNMVLALSMDQINLQIASLFAQGIIDSKLSFSEVILGAEVDITGNFKPSTLNVVEGQPEELLLICPVEDGGEISITTYNFKTGKKETTTSSLDGTIYAFKVEIGQVSISGEDIVNGKDKLITDAANSSALDLINQDIKQIPASDFLIQSIFLDFENTNVASFDPDASHFPSILSGDNLTAFQSALTDYYADKKYILGYGNSISNFDVKTMTNAMFRPTLLQFSTSYVDENSPSNCLNFLMMVNGAKLSGSGSVSTSLIPTDAPSSTDGVLGIPYDFFEKQFLDQIITLVGSGISDVIQSLSKQKQINSGKSSSHNYFFGTHWGHIDTNASYKAGSLKSSGDYEWESDPWEIDISSSAQNSSSNIGFGTHSSTSWVDASYKEEDKFYATINIDNSGDDIAITVSLSVTGTQSIDGKSYVPGTVFSGFKPIETDHHTGSGSLTTKTNPEITITLSNGNKGEFEFSISSSKGSFSSKSVSLGDMGEFEGSFSQNISAFQGSVEDIASQIESNLKSNLNNLLSNNIILPLGNVYTFKNLNLYSSPSSGASGSDNAVISSISYAPDPSSSVVKNEKSLETTN